eukprot:15327979-Alexandrium_andersonii.AAC.1
MSASLVGSEMCIRDRHKGACMRASRGPARPTKRKASRRPPCVGARDTDCLLYTSDAADDM